MKKMMTAILTTGLLGTCLGQSLAAEPIYRNGNGDKKGNILTVAVAWKQTAAEYGALYHQAFNIARDRLDQALTTQKPGDKPLCVVTDVDDTLLLHPDYWGSLVATGHDAFDDPLWDEHIKHDKLKAAPGALEFLEYCKAKGVDVFYVTSRDQGEGTYGYALQNLKDAGFPYADTEHLTVLVDTSNKEKVQKQIARDHTIAVYLGDSLNDFQRVYYVKDVDQRNALMEKDKELFGRKFVILPNPTDGHWVRAIFGESEPAPTKQNRQNWKKAATRNQSQVILEHMKK